MSPLEAQPLDVVLYVLNEFCILLHGVCVVEAQVTFATIFLGQSEVDGDGFCVAYVQVTIGLGREARLQTAAVFTGCQVVNHFLFHEANGLLFFCFC